MSPVYRPPSEANSLLIQVTIGCSNNKCTYCEMYRAKNYQVRPIEAILKDIKSAADYFSSFGQNPDKVFLCDGDALGAPMEILIPTLESLNSLFPQLRRVGVYSTAKNILNKTEEELKILASKNLTIAYLGLESGDDEVLAMILKGNTSKEMLEASLKIKRCGFKLSTIAMLGVGGKKYTQQHALQTAKLIGESSPHFFSILTTCALPDTPYQRMIEKGFIQPLTSKELFQEMYDMINLAEFKSNPVIFRANHVSNMHPLGGVLPRDKKIVLENLKRWIESTPEGVYPEMPLEL